MIKIGIIGVGSMGKNHLRVILELNNYYEVMGFFDTDKERSELISKTYGVDSYNSAEELMDKVDAIIIATPASLHYELGLLAAKKRKHILMEKPVCLEVEEAKNLIEKCKGLTCLVSHVERYNPAVYELSDLLKNEDIVGIEIHRCSPYDPRIFDADVIEDLMIHDIDILINEINPGNIKKIQSFGNSKFSKKYFDYVNTIIEFDNGIICSLVASRSTQNKIRTINIHTKNGYITSDMLNKKLTITRKTSYKLYENQKYKQDNIIETLMLPNDEPLKAEYTDFYNCITNNLIPRTNLETATKSLELCKIIQEKTGE